MWICPACGAKLVARNLSHACGPWSVESFLRGKGPRARALFRAFVRLVRAAGPFDYAPAKTRVAFVSRIRFASVNALSERGMRFHLLSRRPMEDRRVTRVETIGGWCVNHFRVERPEDLDDAVARRIAASRKVTQAAASR